MNTFLCNNNNKRCSYNSGTNYEKLITENCVLHVTTAICRWRPASNIRLRYKTQDFNNFVHVTLYHKGSRFSYIFIESMGICERQLLSRELTRTKWSNNTSFANALCPYYEFLLIFLLVLLGRYRMNIKHLNIGWYLVEQNGVGLRIMNVSESISDSFIASIHIVLPMSCHLRTRALICNTQIRYKVH